MSYQYIENSNKPFILVNLAEYGDLDLSEALDLIVGSGVYPDPQPRWLQGHSFFGDTGTLAPAQRQNVDALRALSIIEKFEGKATFIVGLDVGQLADVSELAAIQFPRTITKIQDRSVAAKKFVLVTCNGDAAAYFPNADFGRGRFEKEAERPVGNYPEFETAVNLSAPLRPEDEWPFADDEKWTDYIEKLTEQDIKVIVEKGLHLRSVGRVRAALKETQDHFVKRNHAAAMMVACAMARTNIVFLGPPGTAKSLLVRTFAQALGVRSQTRPIKEENDAAHEATRRHSSRLLKRRMFEYLLTRYTTPEEIFGGADINLLLSAGVHGRRTEGMLPQAEVAFLDEIFKANSAILNTLLSITNERIFYNMGQAFRVALGFVVGASNETPAGDELGALYDRFPIRVPCRPVDASLLEKVISHAHNFESASVLHSSEQQIARCACLNDLRLLSKVIQGGVYGGVEAFAGTGKFEKDFFDMLLGIRRDYGVSDRTPVQVLRLCRALALLEETPASELAPRHLRAWGYVSPTFAAAGDLQRKVKAKIQLREPSAEDLFDEI